MFYLSHACICAYPEVFKQTSCMYHFILLDLSLIDQSLIEQYHIEFHGQVSWTSQKKSLLLVGLYYQCTILTWIDILNWAKKEKGTISSLFHISQTTCKVKNGVPECAPPPTKSQKEATETKIHYKVGHRVPNALEYSEKWLEKDIASLLSEGKHCELWEERGDKNQPPAISKSLRSGPQQGEM